MENYEVVRDLEVGSSCTTRVMKHKETKEVVVMKFIELGRKMFVYVDREIMKHRWFPHPNIVGLREINLTETHLVMVLGYRDEGETFQKLHYSENEIFGRMEKYKYVKDLGAGSFGVTKLMRNKHTKELVAMKFIERGPTIDENVEREIINHRSLHHQNIIRFKEVILTPTHLALVMEYASGGELFERVCNSGGFSEDMARYFFQQLISGVNYIHSMQICHRDLKLDNILLDGSAAPRLKICDFGYSKSSMLYSKPNTTVGSATCATSTDQPKGKYYGKLYPLHSTPNTNVGSPTYTAPEVLVEGQYDGKMADVWSCGVTLYVMLFATYPFEDPDDHKNFEKTITRIKGVYYKIPTDIRISKNCRHLLSRIFVQNPTRRISLKEIKRHPWFLNNLASELTEPIQAIYYRRDIPIFSYQSVEEIMKIVGEARKQLPPSSATITHYESKIEADDETEVEEEEEDGENDVEEEEEDEEDESEEEEDEEDDMEIEEEDEEEDEEEEDGEDDVEEEEEDKKDEDGENDVEEEEEHEKDDMEEEREDKEEKQEEEEEHEEDDMEEEREDKEEKVEEEEEDEIEMNSCVNCCFVFTLLLRLNCMKLLWFSKRYRYRMLPTDDF